jgi:hypothetical protein
MPHCDSPFCWYCEGMEARWLRGMDAARKAEEAKREAEKRKLLECPNCGMEQRNTGPDGECWACGF